MQIKQLNRCPVFHIFTAISLNLFVSGIFITIHQNTPSGSTAFRILEFITAISVLMGMGIIYILSCFDLMAPLLNTNDPSTLLYAIFLQWIILGSIYLAKHKADRMELVNTVLFVIFLEAVLAITINDPNLPTRKEPVEIITCQPPRENKPPLPPEPEVF